MNLKIERFIEPWMEELEKLKNESEITFLYMSGHMATVYVMNWIDFQSVSEKLQMNLNKLFKLMNRELTRLNSEKLSFLL